MKLKLYGKEYDLQLIRDKYSSNGRTFLWLEDTKDWDYFSDISVNDPSVALDDDEVLVNHDFELCFENEDKMVEWLQDNLKCTVGRLLHYYVLHLEDQDETT
jgi:hypothetical protein